MLLEVFRDRIAAGRASTGHAANVTVGAISGAGKARISRSLRLSTLSQVEAFHLEEYNGLQTTHPSTAGKTAQTELRSKLGEGKL
jgi:hypothetical protein